VNRWPLTTVTVFVGTLLTAVFAAAQRPIETTCGSNIISATVVATVCAHLDGDAEMLDLLVLWRGRPGWFQPGAGPRGGGGSSTFGGGQRSRVSQHSVYGETAIAFDADFEAATVTIGDQAFALATREDVEGINTLFVDRVDQPGSRSIATHRLDTRLPLGVDPHVVLAQRSRDMLTYLQCGIGMPAASGPRQPAVATVCDKLRRQ
jgi:hypothetical protein